MHDLESTERLVTGINRFGRALRSSSHRWEQMSIAMRRSDVTVLRWLANHGESRLGDIAEGLGLNPSVISRQLTSLEAEHLVARRVDPADGRAGLVRLSDEGAGRLAEVNRAYAAYLDELVGHWDDTKVDRAADILLELSELLAHDACRTAAHETAPAGSARPDTRPA
ncbi:MAG: MarR family winged helix-turn-helix transcriptional regulator [Nocardioidaceae bacterium]